MRSNPLNKLLNKPPSVCVSHDEILDMPEPDYVVLPMDYTQRELYSWKVAIGDKVRQNQIIAKNSMGVCLHTPISGTVFDIKPIWSEGGIHIPAVCITRGEGDAVSVDEIFEQYGVNPKEATVDDQLKAMGIHPPWLPLSTSAVSEEHTPEAIENVVIVGFDEEPEINIQYNLLAQRLNDVLEGFSFLKTIMPNATQVLLADRNFCKQIKDQVPGEIQLKSISPNYSARLLDRNIPKYANIRFDHHRDYALQKTVVISIERLLVLTAAIKNSQPFTTKYLTVSNKMPSDHKMVLIHHGTSIRSILNFTEFSKYQPESIIAGGPMKGISQFNNLTPLTRSCDGLHLLGEKEITSGPGDHCTNCAACIRICPLNLQVHLIGRYVEFENFTSANEYHPEQCMECGLCSYVCPAQRPLVQFIKLANQYGNQKNEHKPQTQCSIESPLEEWDQHCSSSAAMADSPAASH
ncbi:MAG: 4Fe-4S dicluster domain-containing protein [Candidatus Marinimicrobia bacterium]|jgi:Na+-translocating ferredoxin:NAD+ oxidoreductase subunit C|nr:4Fe-4S dicluster domain-containing protein [Candidatus Neomarinimicrobiota bacterium]MBT4360000.1 4Fe-4S dicluster domain-containing protein [Candidatus Neomarinimicrobiota bacterium]MBT4944736.1 4Fe-4S dicluster domain-containing protein [Candidatus Neomarinimicrobiota bacterium]MBT6010376.1 4Fe-4S dicluster domain-containing protein [Candidatus Neomarinimicrobiota bacterium]